MLHSEAGGLLMLWGVAEKLLMNNQPPPQAYRSLTERRLRLANIRKDRNTYKFVSGHFLCLRSLWLALRFDFLVAYALII